MCHTQTGFCDICENAQLRHGIRLRVFHDDSFIQERFIGLQLPAAEILAERAAFDDWR